MSARSCATRGAVGLVGLFAGTLLVAYLYPWWAGMLISLATLTALLFLLGRPVAEVEPVTLEGGPPRRGPIDRATSGEVSAAM
jgi:hypothetical protein